MSLAPAERGNSRLDELFTTQAEATPNAVAVIFSGGIVSYGELLDAVDRFATDLLTLGVRPGVLVVVCVARTPAMIAVLLAILKAGGAYVPLDHRYPRNGSRSCWRTAPQPSW